MKTKIMGLLAVALLAGPMLANAAVIEISGTTSSDGLWEVSLLTGSFSGSFAVLESQEWWGDSVLAQTFAEATGLSLGTFDQGFGTTGPLFAYDGQRFFPSGNWFANHFTGPSSCSNLSGGIFRFLTEPCTKGVEGRVWAQATRISSVPEPTTLALLGLGLVGMGYARRRKAS